MKKSMKIMTALLLCLLCVSNGYAKDMIQVKGSDTLINLVQRLAEVYMQENPQAAIAVTGGGSGTGIAALINKKCDIADASRGMQAKEIEAARGNGVEPKRVVIAIDGLSVIVNGRNPVTKLTVQQLADIFSGAVTNWKDVGGSDLPITLYGRQSNSGTFEFFREFVVKADFSPRMNAMNGNAQIVEAVKSDAGGIGYVGVGYVQNADGITVLNVAANAKASYFSPLSAADVANGNYPIARPLNQYVNGIPQGQTKDFIEFELGPEGQRIVEEEGFFMIPQEYIEYNQHSVGL